MFGGKKDQLVKPAGHGSIDGFPGAGPLAASGGTTPRPRSRDLAPTG